MTWFEQKHRTKEQCRFSGRYLSKCIDKHHRVLTTFIFQSGCKKTNGNIVNQLVGVTWASQFSYMHSPIAPPWFKFSARVRDALLALSIRADLYRGIVFKNGPGWASDSPPP